MVESAVKITNLCVGYGQVQVLDGVDLEVPSHTVASILGPSGSGKTTLLRAIAGFIPVTSGSIQIGESIVASENVNVPIEDRMIGLVPQEGALFPHLDVAGNVGFGLPGRTSTQRVERKERVSELLELVNLPGMEQRSVHELSGGMQQRVALARALARNPKCVLFDEPFTALDSQLRKELRAQVRELLREFGATALLVTHDEDEAAEFADAVHRIDNGLLVGDQV